MIHGNFAEGRLDFNKGNPPTIRLPEDDSEAVLLFCEILHFSTGIHNFRDYEALHGLAIVCDKYGCTRPLRSWFRSQMSGLLNIGQDYYDPDIIAQEDMSVEQIVKLCYLMNDADTFELASRTFHTCISPADTGATLKTVFEHGVPDRLVGKMTCLARLQGWFTDRITEHLQAIGHCYIHTLAAIGSSLIAYISGGNETCKSWV